MYSYHKIQVGADLSRLLKCKFFIIIKTAEKHLIIFTITDENGKIVCPMNIRLSETKKNSNFDNGKPNKNLHTTAYLTMENNPYCKVIKNEW
jgi:hypothetical protein